MIYLQWWIYIQKFPARAPPPTGPNSFVFTYVFNKKRLCRRLAPPQREILDPPLIYDEYGGSTQTKWLTFNKYTSELYLIFEIAVLGTYMHDCTKYAVSMSDPLVGNCCAQMTTPTTMMLTIMHKEDIWRSCQMSQKHLLHC